MRFLLLACLVGRRPPAPRCWLERGPKESPRPASLAGPRPQQADNLLIMCGQETERPSPPLAARCVEKHAQPRPKKAAATARRRRRVLVLGLCFFCPKYNQVPEQPHTEWLNQERRRFELRGRRCRSTDRSRSRNRATSRFGPSQTHTIRESKRSKKKEQTPTADRWPPLSVDVCFHIFRQGQPRLPFLLASASHGEITHAMNLLGLSLRYALLESMLGFHDPFSLPHRKDEAQRPRSEPGRRRPAL